MADTIIVNVAGTDIEVIKDSALHKRLKVAVQDAEDAKFAVFRTQAEQKMITAIKAVYAELDANGVSSLISQTFVVRFTGDKLPSQLGMYPTNRIKEMQRGSRE